MAALEDSLRAEIFRRSPRGLVLTDAGEALLEPARQMQAGAEAAELAAEREHGTGRPGDRPEIRRLEKPFHVSDLGRERTSRQLAIGAEERSARR